MNGRMRIMRLVACVYEYSTEQGGGCLIEWRWRWLMAMPATKREEAKMESIGLSTACSPWGLGMDGASKEDFSLFFRVRIKGGDARFGGH